MKEKDKILYIGGFELPDKNAAAHRVLSNAKILRELGKEVVFIGITNESNGINNLMNPKVIQGFKCYCLKHPNNLKEWFYYLTNTDLYINIIKKEKNTKAIIFYNFQSIVMSGLMKYCNKNKIKCYSDVTEWYSAIGYGLLYYLLKSFDTWYRMRVLQKRQDGIIAISRYLEKYYERYTNTIYVPPLVDKSEVKWNETFEKSKDYLNIIYAGIPGLNKKDCIDKLIEAIPYVKRKIRFDIIGISKSEYLTLYPNHKIKLENNNEIVFHGKISHLDTLRLVKQANYSCFFRNDDRVSLAGFPTKFVESISSGTPVLTNNTSNLREYADGMINGIILKDINPQTIAECINQLPLFMPVDKNLFDYHNYIDTFENLFKSES